MKTTPWGIEVQCVQWIVLMFNNMPVADEASFQKSFSRQELNKIVYAIAKTIRLASISLTASFSCKIQYCVSTLTKVYK